jgi:hypothetical protein
MNSYQKVKKHEAQMRRLWQKQYNYPICGLCMKQIKTAASLVILWPYGIPNDRWDCEAVHNGCYKRT